MSFWTTALEGRSVNDERVEFETPDPIRQAMEHTVITPLVHLAVLDVTGPGADKLLQGQTSAQVALADGTFAPLTCFCTAKGRMLANAQLLRIGAERYRLILHRGLVAPLRDHLKKFAPFYKSELSERDDLVLLGIIGKRAHALAERHLGHAAPAIWHQSGDEAWQLLAHPGPVDRLALCLPQEKAEEVIAGLGNDVSAVGNAVWCLHDIQAGLAWLTPTHHDALLPQMINWEALGGISFKKGCYTGQEVVARAHFRGQVKKRLARARVDAGSPPALGAAVVDENGKNLGEVVAAELDGAGQVEILAVMSKRDEAGPLSVEGHPVSLLPLPYPIERVDPENMAAATST